MNLTQVRDSYMLFFSSDAKLLDALSAKLTQREEAGGGSMVIVQETLHITSISESDIIVYDLDLANGNLERTVKDVCRIKKKESRKPLVLVGEKHALNTALKDPDIALRASCSFAKPVMANQVIMSIDMVLNENTNLSKVVDQPVVEKKINYTRRALVVAALLGVIGVGWFALMVNTPPQNPIGSRYSEQPQASPSLPVSEQVNKEPDKQADIDALNTLAEKALAGGRIFAPEGDNALHYFDRALQIDSYNTIAYAGRQKLLDDLRASFPILLGEQRFDEASEALNRLSQLEPFSDANATMQDALDDAQTAADDVAEQSNEQANGTADTEPSAAPEAALAASEPVRSISKNETERAIKREQRLALEQKTLDQINAAITAQRLIPPQANNAYSLLLEASRSQAITASKARSITDNLAGRLTSLAQTKLNSDALQPAQELLNYAKNIQADNPTIRKLERTINIRKTQAAQAALASRANPVAAEQLASAPVLLDRVDAEYPRRAFNLDIEGWVELQYQVDQNGTPVNIQVVAEEPKKMFTKAATKALKKWRFEPAKNQQTGEAVLSPLSSTKFNFALGG